MHRSGTSLLGRLVQALGVYLPGELIAGDEHNLSGYYERSDVTEIHEQLLIDLNRWWPTTEGCLALPRDWLETPQARMASDRLRRILTEEIGRQHGPWAIKDPRLCRLLPLWHPLLISLGIPTCVLYSLRDPREVCASLLHRDGPLVGMDLERAETLWCMHNAELLLHARHLPCHGFDYGLWFTNPRPQLEYLARALKLPVMEASLLNALAAIDPAHRRSHAVTLPRPLRPDVLRHHRRLQRRLAREDGWSRHRLLPRLRRLARAIWGPAGLPADPAPLEQRNLKRR